LTRCRAVISFECLPRTAIFCYRNFCSVLRFLILDLGIFRKGKWQHWPYQEEPGFPEVTWVQVGCIMRLHVNVLTHFLISTNNSNTWLRRHCLSSLAFIYLFIYEYINHYHRRRLPLTPTDMPAQQPNSEIRHILT